MYYIEVEMYGGEVFKYITGSERDVNFFKTLTDNSEYAIKRLDIINLYNRKETTENDN